MILKIFFVIKSELARRTTRCSYRYIQEVIEPVTHPLHHQQDDHQVCSSYTMASHPTKTRLSGDAGSLGFTVSQLSTSFDSVDDASSSPRKSPKSPLSGNPLKYDPELMGLIDKLDGINSYRTFRRWKASFMRRFKTFLSEKGIQPAEESYAMYSSNMERFEKKVNTVQAIIHKGDLSVDKTTVKGRNALNEMSKTMTEVIDETEDLIPSKHADEKRKGYNKYHLGAALVQDGFLEYDRMVRCNDKTKDMVKQGLNEIADRQQLEEIERYERQIQQFVDVMQDLGLYEVMVKCRQFAEGEIDEIILLDPKTGAVMELSREECFAKGILTMIQDAEGKDRIREEEVSRVEKVEIISTLQVNFNM
jgi:hypothetical protein